MHSDQNIESRRSLRLISLNAWCMQRISMLSLSGDHAEAQAMTNEHIENLENTNTDATLWILAYRS